jgi:hypothetical protein
MQKFPEDSRDAIEQMYGKHVMTKFPSYGRFWEEFIGDSYKYHHVPTPRPPIFPKKYSNSQITKYKDAQTLLSKVSYSVFCNLVAAETQLAECEKALPLSNSHFTFWAIESFECGYFHIGNVGYALERMWGKIRKVFFTKPISDLKELTDYLKTKKKDNNWEKLHDEPKNIRDNLVHLCRHLFKQHKGNFYLQLYVEKDKYLWKEMKINGWMKASEKLENHIQLTYAACEDVYSSLLPDIKSYLKKEGIQI